MHEIKDLQYDLRGPSSSRNIRCSSQRVGFRRSSNNWRPKRMAPFALPYALVLALAHPPVQLGRALPAISPRSTSMIFLTQPRAPSKTSLRKNSRETLLKRHLLERQQDQLSSATPPGETSAAIARLLNVEITRLVTSCDEKKPAAAMELAFTWLESRRPLLHWGVALAIKQKLSAPGRQSMLPADAIHATILDADLLASPTLDVALQRLAPQIRREIFAGLRHSPLRTCRVLFRACQLSTYGFLARRFPARFKGRRPPGWLIRFLEHTAIALEETAPKTVSKAASQAASAPSRRLGSARAATSPPPTAARRLRRPLQGGRFLRRPDARRTSMTMSARADSEAHPEQARHERRGLGKRFLASEPPP